MKRTFPPIISSGQVLHGESIQRLVCLSLFMGARLPRFACHAQNALDYVAVVMQPPKLSIDALEHCSKGTPTIFVMFRTFIMQ